MAEEQRPRVVLDTNVFVSGLISASGPPARILDAVRNRKLIHLVSDPIMDEYVRVLNYPRIRKFSRISDEFLADVAAYVVYRTERVELISRIRLSPDPDDDVFLQTALDGRADLLVSGDKADLLALQTVESIPIVTAAEAVRRLKL